MITTTLIDYELLFDIISEIIKRLISEENKEIYKDIENYDYVIEIEGCKLKLNINMFKEPYSYNSIYIYYYANNLDELIIALNTEKARLTKLVME